MVIRRPQMLQSTAMEATTEVYEPLELPVDATAARQLDARLVRAACRGDREAMAELHRRYAPMIHGIVLSRCPLREAEDLTQDVFVQAIAKLRTLRDPERVAAWLAMIARNAATDHHRRKRPNAELDEAKLADGDGEDAERRLHAVRVLGCIHALPEAYREVLVLRLVEGMTGPEIAERTGLTAGSVRVNLHRGMKLLRQSLHPEETP